MYVMLKLKLSMSSKTGSTALGTFGRWNSSKIVLPGLSSFKI